MASRSKIIRPDFSERVRELRTQHNMTQKELGERVNKSESAVRMWELGKSQPDLDTVALLCETFQISADYLILTSVNTKFPSNIFPIKTKKFPILGEIACGKPIFANEDHESYISASSEIKADWCLVARGDSMIGARIHDGDIVFIREQSIVENGEIAAVMIGDEATLKRWYYYPDKGKLILNAENPAYEPLVYTGEELNEIRCLGKAVCFMSNL